MAKDIKNRLQSLASRRTGFPKNTVFGMDALNEGYSVGPREEKYQTRAQKENSKYALGAMEEVDPKYTAVSISEAERVKNQLRSGFDALSISVDFKLQGSVAANLHIKGASDVDMLLLDDRFYTYDSNGSKAKSNKYTTPYAGKTPTESLKEIRAKALDILQKRFPETTVNPGAKAIGMSGGSLRREIDIVPSHWHETEMYQNTLLDYFKGVYILNNDEGMRVFNQPFLHIQRIDEKNNIANGSLKKSIRLCKNIKQDAMDEGESINFSSFDISAVMWHSNLYIWKYSVHEELGILAETARHLRFLGENRNYARTLDVPDGSRKIFDNETKFTHFDKLAREVGDLAIEVAIEHGASSDWEQVQKVLKAAIVV